MRSSFNIQFKVFPHLTLNLSIKFLPLKISFSLVFRLALPQRNLKWGHCFMLYCVDMWDFRVVTIARRQFSPKNSLEHFHILAEPLSPFLNENQMRKTKKLSSNSQENTEKLSVHSSSVSLITASITEIIWNQMLG